jgi:hypothetical protein
LRDMGLVRELDGLLDRRHAPIGPVNEGQANNNNYYDYDCSFHPRCRAATNSPPRSLIRSAITQAKSASGVPRIFSNIYVRERRFFPANGKRF